MVFIFAYSSIPATFSRSCAVSPKMETPYLPTSSKNWLLDMPTNSAAWPDDKIPCPNRDAAMIILTLLSSTSSGRMIVNDFIVIFLWLISDYYRYYYNRFFTWFGSFFRFMPYAFRQKPNLIALFSSSKSRFFLLRKFSGSIYECP